MIEIKHIITTAIASLLIFIMLFSCAQPVNASAQEFLQPGMIDLDGVSAENSTTLI